LDDLLDGKDSDDLIHGMESMRTKGRRWPAGRSDVVVVDAVGDPLIVGTDILRYEWDLAEVDDPGDNDGPGDIMAVLDAKTDERIRRANRGR
jgi:hypothetical protein